MTDTEILIQRSQNGDMNARSLLVEQNYGLIWSVVKRFIGRGVEAEDLFQLGSLGFLKAIDGFNLEFGTQFSTYAVPKISGEIRRFLRDDGALKVSRGIKERAVIIKATQSQLASSLGREPSVFEISEHTGICVEDIAVAVNATAAIESIHQENGEDGFCLENILTDSDSEEIMLERITLQHSIDMLSEREGLVIKLRYFHGLTQERVSKILKVSQVQVSRIEKKALSQLKELMS